MAGLVLHWHPQRPAAAAAMRQWHRGKSAVDRADHRGQGEELPARGPGANRPHAGRSGATAHGFAGDGIVYPTRKSSFPIALRRCVLPPNMVRGNRKNRGGYEVIMIPMKNGKATGEYEDFLTGFVTSEGQVWAGRGRCGGHDGALYVTRRWFTQRVARGLHGQVSQYARVKLFPVSSAQG